MNKPRSVVSVLLCALAMCPTGLALAQDDEVDVEPIVNLLREPDKEFRALALEQIRKEYPGAAATRKFAEVLTTLPADAQTGLLSALADRGDSAAAPAVRGLLTGSQDAEVRLAAIKALGKLGQPDDLPALIELLGAPAQGESDAAKRSLVVLEGEEISAELAKQMTASAAPLRIQLIEILTTRRARSTIPAILEAAIDDDASVRRAAMAALAKIGEPQHVPGMAKGVLKAERGRERDAAEKAVMLVCHRGEGLEQQAAPLLEYMQTLPDSQNTALLPTLGRVGGPQALEVVEEAIASSDGQMHDVGLTALCNWPNASIAFRLLELARTEEKPGHRRRALRALIRVAPFPDDRADQMRLDQMRTAMAMCWEDDDRKLILERAKAIRTLDTLNFVLPYLDEPPFSEQACLTVVELAHHSGLREAHREEFHQALDRVIATSKDATVVDRAQRYKKGQTWVRPKGKS